MMSVVHDIIVVGGGHAGIEAALAAARLGLRVAMVTHDRREIGRLPCNPAIGGLGKGHLVREIDVLGGEMGRAIDDTVLHLRVLNRKKGPAVQAPRAQADKHAYQARLEAMVCEQPGLTVIEEDCCGLVAEPAPAGAAAPLVARGVRLGGGRELRGARVVLCTGTFLRGLMHVGATQRTGGREGAASSEGLSGELLRLGFKLFRLKTGTPPRVLGSSLDTARLQVQSGDVDPLPFSFRTRSLPPPRIVCWLTHTNARTHQIIRENLHRSPLFGGVIEGQGPRYCPSIEDKVVRFAERERHVVFLEPEGLDTDEVYVNGVSTSLPADTQVALIRSIAGLERAEVARYGYAVEYDSVPSWQVRPTLETKPVAGLYLAGQILGTSGYEEAAAQGLVAGVNACRDLTGQEPWLPARNVSYLGVLIDDLVTKEILEPYRMFTSRAEHRLRLRCDNAETRLEASAAELGLLPASDLEALRQRNGAVRALVGLLANWRANDGGGGPAATAADLLRQPGVDLASLRDRLSNGTELMIAIDNTLSPIQPLAARAALAEVGNTIVYSGYIMKNDKHLDRQTHLENVELPADFDYAAIAALSFEAREKLGRMRPATLGQAGRIDGVRAGDLAVLTIHLRRWRETLDCGDGHEDTNA
jgi:tRNA uridine 5-carboxymethylaminomethyl modification enzyme